MKKRKVDEELFNELNPIIEGMGFTIVELNSLYAKGTLKLTLVLYRPEGFSIDDCVVVHKTVGSRLEMMKPDRDVYVEIFSPGIGRILKTVEELVIFKGSLVSLLLWNTQTWIEGEIGDIVEENLQLLNQDHTETQLVRLNDIQKVKLY